MTITHSTIELQGLTFHAHHGVLPEERLLGNTFIVDLTLMADISHAIATDELCGTINYAEAYEVVKSEMDTPSQLLEHVCGRIGSALLRRFATLQSVQVRVAKCNPPIEGAGNCLSAVTLTFVR
ncbi:MAG: dihydroneopterin aldolase [Bacteroidaceae bacterium]|nr:dihydroneopterin aldolase [Bacteroidaceae bacterium]